MRAFFPPGRGAFVQNGKLQSSLPCIHAVEDDADLLAKGELASPALADDLPCVFAIRVEVAVHLAETLDGYQALDKKVIQLDEEAVPGWRQDQCVEVLTDAVLHKLDLFPLNQFAFGIGSAAFCFTALLRNAGQGVAVQAFARGAVRGAQGKPCDGMRRMRSTGRERTFAADSFMQKRFGNAVHDQIRVAPDG